MNARDFKPILRALTPHFPGFVGHKRLFLQAPIGGMLRAINFDPSAFDKVSFYPSTLIMPLCVPNDFFSLLFGERLRHKTECHAWTATMPDLVPGLVDAIKTQGIPALSQASTTEGFLALADKYRGNPHTEKDMAFVLARAGERERAIALIDEYLPKLKITTPWLQEIFDLSSHLRDLLVRDPDAAHRQLLEWEDYTIQKLRLEQYR